QLQFRREMLDEAVHRTRRLRSEAVERKNEKKSPTQSFREGDLVLVWDAIKQIDMSSSRKLDDRWLGPYRVRDARPDKGYYRLEDLNGVPFPSTTRADRMKAFQKMPSTTADNILKGRLKMYPISDSLIMVRPVSRETIRED
ncbi:hypothetical protein COCCADRAFT_112306, partial [Bipolaris zeicola 26-R-13]